MTVDQFFLSGAWNFRDVGGLRTDDGRTVKTGILFRSSELTALDDAGRQALLDLGVADVVDLRGRKEVKRSGPDALPPGVALHTTPVHEPIDDARTPTEEMNRAPHEARAEITPEVAEAKLEEAYREYPLLDGAKAALAGTVRLLADGDAAVLVHCAAGKDRAGWITSSLLRTLGVNEADIIADYLRSNDAVAPLRAAMQQKYGDSALLTDRLLGVGEDLLRSSWKVVDDEYGSFANYLTAIGVDDELIERLRARLLD